MLKQSERTETVIFINLRKNLKVSRVGPGGSLNTFFLHARVVSQRNFDGNSTSCSGTTIGSHVNLRRGEVDF